MNPNSITPFNFEGNEISIEIDSEGNPHFIAKPVCKTLGIEDTSRAVSRLDDDEKGTTTIRTPGGEQEVLTITESGLYSLIMTSRKPEAKRFKKWVTSVVLPQIRKTGSYIATDEKPISLVDIFAQSVQLFADHEKRLKEIEARQGAILDRSNYYQVQAYARLIGKPVSTPTASKLGKWAAEYSRKHNIEIKRDPDPRYTWINQYHRTALDYAFGKMASTYPLLED